jgi:hypothetical protein
VKDDVKGNGMNPKIIIFDCNNESRPAICFNLEIAKCEPRIVFDEKEAINLLEIAQHTGEKFDCLLVNNPYLNVDITWLVEQGERLGTDIPIIFVKQSRPLQGIIAALHEQYPDVNLHFSEPAHIADLVLSLTAARNARKGNLVKTKIREKTGWRWQWGKQS